MRRLQAMAPAAGRCLGAAAAAPPRLAHATRGGGAAARAPRRRWLNTCTLAIHADGPARPAAARTRDRFSTDLDIAPPISMTSTFECEEGGHVYSRQTEPLRDRCEVVLAAIEALPSAEAQSSVHAMLYSSGLAACHAILVALAPDSDRVLISGGYHGTHQVLDVLRRLKPDLQVIELPALGAGPAEPAVQARDIVWLETPRNPMCEVYDIEGYAAAAKQAGAKVVVDGTFAPPPLQRPLELGADAVMHSTTKYLSGHSDAVGGALCVKDPELAEQLRAERTAIGAVPGSLETWLLLRSLRTLQLRVERQCASATAIAAWLNRANAAGNPGGADPSHPLYGLVTKVWHPSISDHPGHAVAVKQMPLFGGTMAVEFDPSVNAERLPYELHLFRNATSLGGVESLVEWRRKYDETISPNLLRLSVGLEDPADLQEDLVRAALQMKAG